MNAPDGRPRVPGDDAERARMGEAARDAEYSVDAVGTRYVALLREVLPA